MLRLLLLFSTLHVLTRASPLLPSFNDDEPLKITEQQHRDPSKYRLPNTTIPLEYDISVVVDPDATTFRGWTTIRLRAQNDDVSSIVLHSNGLNITNHVLKDVTTNEVIVSTVELSGDDRDFVIVKLGNATLVRGGSYDVEFQYVATYSSGLLGLYKSSYLVNGTRRYLVATKIQPVYARRVFPCFDEPALKAIFNIHVYSPPSYHALSNMDAVPSERPQIDGFNVTSFRSTPLMSTFLIAFVVSDFAYKSNIEDGPIIYPREVRVYAKPTSRNDLDYSLDVVQRSFQYMQAYVDVSYRLPKLDNIALPDYAAGASENWGLVAYREDFMLYTEGITSTSAQMRIASITTHENAHFWFGNEVSPKWWDYFWLNEGFATYFESYATDKVHNGEWRLMELFSANDLQNVMNLDSTPTINPMNAKVGSPSEIAANYNGIAYQKAGCVIRMMQHILGEDVFRLGLSRYIKSLPTGTTEPELLFEALQSAADDKNIFPEGVTVSDVFGSWANQAGFPVIYATRGINGTSINIRQERYYQNSTLTSNSSWWVPLTWSYESNPNFNNTAVQMWLPPRQSLSIPIDSREPWFVLNKQQMGYFRVMYDEISMGNLMDVLKSENHIVIHPANKAQLIDDIYAFTRTDRKSYGATLNILSYLTQETDWIPWIPSDRIFTFLNPKMPASANHTKYKTFVAELSKNAFVNVGLTVQDQDAYTTKRMRNLITRISCNAGYAPCLETANVLLSNSIENNEKIHPDVQFVVYCYGIKRSNSIQYWNHLLDKYSNSQYESKMSIIINALGCSEDDAIIESYLELASDDSKILAKDRENAFRSVINSGTFGIRKVIEFLIDFFPSMKLSRNVIITALGNVIVLDDHAILFERFAEIHRNNFTSAEANAVATARTSIQNNNLWTAKYMDIIDVWLSANVQ